MKRTLTLLLCLGLAFVALRTAQAADGSEAVKAPKQKAALPASAATAAPAADADSLPRLVKAIGRDSSNFDALFRLGIAYLDRDSAAAAAKVLSRARVLRPKDHRVLVNLGVALDQSNRSRLAQDVYREALKLVPADSVALCRLASSLYADAKYSDCMTVLVQVMHDSPSAYCAYFQMGVALADAGIYRDAIRMWRKVVELAPTSPEAISAKESMDVLEKFVAQ